MRANLDRAWRFIQKWEGGSKFTQDPDDPGGATKYGISGKAHGLTPEQVRALTEEEAKSIFLSEYWLPAGCDLMPFPLDIVVADSVFNLGLDDEQEYRHRLDAQATVSAQDWKDFLVIRMEKHVRVAKNSEIAKKYLFGWLSRCLDLYKEAYR